MEKYPVYLNIYEESQWFNKILIPLGLGLYHTAVQVHGTEYAFGVHKKPTSGIYPSIPQQDDLLPSYFRFRESILIGYTTYAKPEVRSLITDLGHQWTGISYHPVDRNCNAFSAHLCQVLCKADPPPWINRTIRILGALPFGQHLLNYGGKKS